MDGAPLAPDFVLSDKYQLLRVVGSGGTGSVWVARNLALDCEVAVKILKEEMLRSDQKQRLVREARLAARAEHDNIVRIHDLGFTDGNIPYIVMELLEGRDLRAELEAKGSFTPVRAVQLLLPVLEGLAHSHDRDVVHRDVKPENIFLERSHDGDRVVPKLIDFGIARCLADLDEARLTVSGSVFGTAHYLSPEQALGQEDVDYRADIWSACAVLYECIVGHPPFGDRDAAHAIRAIIEEDAPPIPNLTLGDEQLGPIVMRGLSRDRDQRYGSARELADALASWLASRGVNQAPAPAHSLGSDLLGIVPEGTPGAPRARLSPDAETKPAD